jgi:hypothetical protein
VCSEAQKKRNATRKKLRREAKAAEQKQLHQASVPAAKELLFQFLHQDAAAQFEAAEPGTASICTNGKQFRARYHRWFQIQKLDRKTVVVAGQRITVVAGMFLKSRCIEGLDLLHRLRRLDVDGYNRRGWEGSEGFTARCACFPTQKRYNVTYEKVTSNK